MVMDIMVTDYLLAKFYVPSAYMNLMGIQWNLVPTVIFILSLISLIFAGMSAGGKTQVVEIE